MLSNSQCFQVLRKRVEEKNINLSFDIVVDILRGQIIPSVIDVERSLFSNGYLDCYKFLDNCGIDLNEKFIDSYKKLSLRSVNN